MAERVDEVVGGEGQPAEPQLRGAPRVLVRCGAPGGGAQQRGSSHKSAPQYPPGRQGDRQAQRGSPVVLQSPGQALVRGGVLGVQPPRGL